MKRARQIYLGIDLGAASGRVVAGVRAEAANRLGRLQKEPD